MLIIIRRTRSTIRKRSDIAGYDYEDYLCAWFYPFYPIGQILRHMVNYDAHDDDCCSCNSLAM